MHRIFLALILVFLLVITLSQCGGGGDSGNSGSTGTSAPFYANWWCTGAQCASVMGGYSGTAGPFPTLDQCEKWRQTYILTSVCETSPGSGGPPPTITSFAPTSGPPGTTVTIIGTNFPTDKSQIAVTMNGVTATLVGASSTQIVFTVPYMTDFSGPITVTTPAGITSSSNLFSVSTTLNIYKNGIFYPDPGGNLFHLWYAIAGGSVSNTSQFDGLTGDTTVLGITSSDAYRFGIMAQYTNIFYDASSYIPSGHIHFNIKLALPSSNIISIKLVGTSGTNSNPSVLQSSSVSLNPSDYSTTEFRHVSIPLSSFYPPVTVSKYVNTYIELQMGQNTGATVPIFYVNDIKWTSN